MALKSQDSNTVYSCTAEEEEGVRFGGAASTHPYSYCSNTFALEISVADTTLPNQQLGLQDTVDIQTLETPSLTAPLFEARDNNKAPQPCYRDNSYSSTRQQGTCASQSQAKPVLRKMTKCRFFFSERGCSKGDMCTFSHEVTDDAGAESASLSQQTANSQLPRSKPVCRFYASGYCKWGNR